MKLPPPIHPWKLTPRAAAELQQRLATQVVVAPPAQAVRLVAGLDAALSPDGQHIFGAVVLWDLLSARVIEQHSVRKPLAFPYVPGLLSFREAPVLLATLRKLRTRPDALLCDAQGLAHPRRFGLACHLGLLCRLPSVGCAKSLLVGTHPTVPAHRGAAADLMHQGERIGVALRTRAGVRPVFVSVGHQMDLPAAARLVLDCTTRFRLPEPTRLADQFVAQAKRTAG